MRSMSKLVIGAMLIMGLSLLIVLGLVLVLLAELYCSLLRRRRLPLDDPNPTSDATHQKGAEEGVKEVTTTPCSDPLHPSSSSSPYAQGVLRSPPRSLLFGVGKEEAEQLKRQHQPSASLHLIGLISTSSQTASTSLLSHLSTPFQTKPTCQVELSVEEECGGGSAEQFVCISNPIYDEEACIGRTPFQTPDTSPSRLEDEDRSDMEEEDATISPSPPDLACVVTTPPLTPMKKLPPNAASVTLIDGRSLMASTSDSNVASSSSTSGSPCTSPSW